MDPAHGPYMLKSIPWRGEKSMHDKDREFGRSEFGVAMKRYPPVKRFLRQDLNVVVKQQRGLAFNSQLMPVNDSDIQANGCFHLKKSFWTWRKDGGPFDNQVRYTAMRWRS